MTIEGAIAQLQEFIDNEGIPFWAKPGLQKVKETVEAERERHIEESKTGRWISHIEYGIHGSIQCWVCSECRELFSYDAETGIEITDYQHCPNCGAEMKGAEE